MNKKFFLGLLLLGLLVGCDNPTEINDGVPPPVIVNGSVGGATFNGEGLAAFAKVQFIGIDQYGQPQRNSEGEYLGQVYHTNENGVLENAQISGSYLGPLLVVASYDKYSETVIDGESIERETALTCPLPNGCVNENNEAVAFGDSFAPPASFKLMAVVHEVTDPLTINVSPLTHLAAKLAFGDFISDGTSCDNSTCLADIFSKGLINAEKIYEANSRLQKQALINTGFPVNIAPWQSESITDTVIQQDAAKHGLLSNVFFQDMVTRGESTQQVLDWWVDSYLVNKGQLIEDDQANAIKQLDFRHLFNGMNRF